jgi:hypothetical protein
MEVATIKFPDMPVGTNVTMLETSRSFLDQVIHEPTKENPAMVKHEICQSRL